ncbi:MAG: CPCC family cysteine-rich protein, partial [Acidovorax sp.]|uniref:CPCC family cysteine-rich protein n=1 Tax=Acidovorax sp. TaxID=1872122 RepID=UPI0026149789
KQPNSQTAKQPNSQTAKQPNSQTAKQPNSQTAKQPNSQTSLSCPYCRQLTLKVLGGFEICPVCFWEDDGQKNDDDATVIRGASNGKHRDSQLCGLRYC